MDTTTSQQRKGPPASLRGASAKRLMLSLLSADEKAEIIALAARHRISVSRLVRRLVFGLDSRTRDKLASREPRAS